MQPYSPAMRAWVQAELGAMSDPKRVVLLKHAPVWLGRDSGFLDIGQELALSGHSHVEGPIGGNERMLASGDLRALTGYLADGRPHGYRIVVVEKDRMDSFYKGYGETRAVMIHTPRRHSTHRGAAPLPIRGQAFDPKGGIRELGVSLGGTRLKVNRAKRRLWSDFAAEADVMHLVDGFHDLVVKVETSDGAYRLTQPCLILTGKEERFRASGPARLVGDAYGMTARGEVWVNGVRVGTIRPEGKHMQAFAFAVPAGALKRVNRIALKSAPARARLWNVKLSHEGRDYVDHRQTWAGMAPGIRQELYIDLKRPGIEGWQVK
jgi:hypothetical protein